MFSVSPETWMVWEKETQPIDEKKLVELGWFFGVSVSELLSNAPIVEEPVVDDFKETEEYQNLLVIMEVAKEQLAKAISDEEFEALEKEYNEGTKELSEIIQSYHDACFLVIEQGKAFIDVDSEIGQLIFKIFQALKMSLVNLKSSYEKYQQLQDDFNQIKEMRASMGAMRQTIETMRSIGLIDEE